MKKITIEQLSEQTGFTARTIRYYVQKGIILPPAGRGRGGFYNEEHLRDLNHIRKLKSDGISLAAIKNMANGGLSNSPVRVGKGGKLLPAAVDRAVRVYYTLAPGLSLEVSRAAEEMQKGLIQQIIGFVKAMEREDLKKIEEESKREG